MSTQQEEMYGKQTKIQSKQEERNTRQGERNKKEEKLEEKIQVSLKNFPVIQPTELDKYKFKILTLQDRNNFLKYFRKIKHHLNFHEELKI